MRPIKFRCFYENKMYEINLIDFDNKEVWVYEFKQIEKPKNF